MSKKQLPLKMRVLDWVLDYGKPFDADDVYNAIHEEYKGERFCNPKHIDRLIGAMCGNMIFDLYEGKTAPGEELKIKYQITEFGKQTGRLIPGRS